MFRGGRNAGPAAEPGLTAGVAERRIGPGLRVTVTSASNDGGQVLLRIVRGASGSLDHSRAHLYLVVPISNGEKNRTDYLKHFFLGSVAERVVRMAPQPVLIVKHEEDEE